MADEDVDDHNIRAGRAKAAANSGGITGGSGGQLKKGKFTYV